MTTKFIFLFVLLSALIKLSFGQVSEKKDSTFFFDADSTCLGIFYKTNDNIDSTIYWNLGNEKISVSFEVPKYRLDIDSLNSLLLDKFRERLDFIEVNGAALVFILLKEDKIVEMRIGKRIGYNRRYDDLIKETLMIAQNIWYIPKEVDKPLLFVYLFKMR